MRAAAALPAALLPAPSNQGHGSVASASGDAPTLHNATALLRPANASVYHWGRLGCWFSSGMRAPPHLEPKILIIILGCVGACCVAAALLILVNFWRDR